MRTSQLHLAEEYLAGHPDRLADAIAENIAYEARQHMSDHINVRVDIRGSKILINGVMEIPKRQASMYSPPATDLKRLPGEIVHKIIPGVMKDCHLTGSWALPEPAVCMNAEVIPSAVGTSSRRFQLYGPVTNVGYATFDKRTRHMPLAVHVARSLRDSLNMLAAKTTNGIGPCGKLLVQFRELPDGTFTWDRLLISVLHFGDYHAGRVIPLVKEFVHESLKKLEKAIPGISSRCTEAICINPIAVSSANPVKLGDGCSGLCAAADYYGIGHPTGAPFVGTDWKSPERVSAKLARHTAVLLAIACRSRDVRTSVIVHPKEGTVASIAAIIDGQPVDRQEIEDLITLPAVTYSEALNLYDTPKNKPYMKPGRRQLFQLIGADEAWEQ